VLPTSGGAFDAPEWWAELDAGRPVVHVTQGTIANGDLDRLIGPTLRALADRDVLVVATTGNEQSAAELRKTAPANARVEAFLPYDQLLGKVDVMITNGGYGGVQFALANGVPLVVAGDTEDKPEIAARVAWTGAGINLRTGSPSSTAVGDAVRRILAEAEFRASAQRLGEQFNQTTPLRSIARALDDAVRVNQGNPAPTGHAAR
jgi:UDP:flavonoid glycosyltransferase YjiC (YdhE family)